MKLVHTLAALLLSVTAYAGNGADICPSDTAKVKLQKIRKAETDAAAITEKETQSRKEKRETLKPARKVQAPRATFPGGEKGIREFIKKTLRYPKECEAERASGRVVVAVRIMPDGTPHSAKVERSSGNAYFDKEALRIASLMPKWTAAEGGKGEEFTYRMTITFRPKHNPGIM